MKKKILIILVGILLIILLYELYYYFYHSPMAFIKSNAVSNINKCHKVADKDTYDGFHGDGKTITEYDCSNVDVKLNMEKLKELPLTENLDLMMYGGTKDGKSYNLNLAKDSMPKIENGYYYFYDDYADTYNDIDDYTSDEKLFDRASFNFKIIIYDSDTKHLYFFELDT